MWKEKWYFPSSEVPEDFNYLLDGGALNIIQYIMAKRLHVWCNMSVVWELRDQAIQSC